MDIGSAFTFMFDDKDWIKKIAIGGVAMLLGIVIVPMLTAYGYMLQTLKNARDNQPTPLPEWNDLGNLTLKGLMVVLIGLIYSIPALIPYCALIAVTIAAQEVDSDQVNMLGALSACLGCTALLFILLAAVIFPAAIIRYAQFDTFSSAFQIREIFSFISSNVGDYAIVVLLILVASFIAQFGFILLCVGLYFTTFWSLLVMAHLCGQLARRAREPLAAAM
ncbi:MAG: DUF4013 domain-containing protein [Anaerolineae bacterium]